MTTAIDYSHATRIPPEPPDLTEEEQVGGVTGFWGRRHALRHIHTFARARRASPLATLGVVLVKAAAAVEPTVVLPPTVGTYASLNLFTALTAASGGGKGASEGAAHDAVSFVDHAGFKLRTDCFPPGSGEGIARTFVPYLDNQDKDSDGKPKLKRRSRAVFSAPEIDTLAALGGRRGSTLLPELRKVYSGEQIGFKNAADATTTPVDAHSYRACLIVGVQPAKAGALLNDSDGGTPQRFVWLPADDPDAPDTPPECPEPLTVKLPDFSKEQRTIVRIPQTATDEIVSHRLAVLRGTEGVDPLDGHALLCRLKVAAALMILDGRAAVNVEDWELAGAVMRASSNTRATVRAVLADKKKQANRAKAHDDAERVVIVNDKVGKSDAEKVRGYIHRKLQKVGAASESELAACVPGKLRNEWFTPVFTELVDSKLIVPTAKNQKGNDVYSIGQ